MESLLEGNEFLAAMLFFTICFLQPIVLPIPEAATVTAGSAVLGPFTAALLSFAGTFFGIFVMYVIAKAGGKKLVRKFMKEKHMEKYERYAAKNELSILFILFVIPILPDEIICVGAGISGVRISIDCKCFKTYHFIFFSVFCGRSKGIVSNGYKVRARINRGRSFYNGHFIYQQQTDTKEE